jgi:hypothetical protein
VPAKGMGQPAEARPPSTRHRGYRACALTRSQVRRLLAYPTRMEVDALMKKAGVYLDYTEEGLEQDLETHRELRGLRDAEHEGR